MLYLILAFMSSATIAIVMRLSSHKVTGRFSMLAVNYIVCALMAACYAGFDLFPASSGVPAAIGMGAATGVLYLAGFVLMQWSTRQNGVVLSSVFMKLGLLVSLVCSIVIFGETPTWIQAVGFSLAIGAIVLINLHTGTEQRAASKWMLILLLLAGGGGDVMAKVFETWGSLALADPFLFYVFFIALILCVVLVIMGKERPGAKEWLYGTLIGIPNFFSAKFLLAALGELPAVIVYPTFSVSTILIVTLTGVLFFKERLKKHQWIALAMILVALVLLNI